MLLRSTAAVVLLWTVLCARCDALEQQPLKLSTQPTDYIPLSNLTTIHCIVPDAYNIGVVFICHHAISELSIVSRELTIVAGNSSEVGYSNGIGPDARFFYPSDVLQTNEHSLLIADTRNHCIREVVAGNTTTFAGVCTDEGYRDGAKMESHFSYPTSILKTAENQFVIIDTRNHRLRLITQDIVRTLENEGRPLQLPYYSTCLGIPCRTILVSTQDELVPLAINEVEISRVVYPKITCQLNQPRHIARFHNSRYFILDHDNQVIVVDLSREGSCTPLTTVSSPQAVAYLNYSEQLLISAGNKVGLHVFSLFNSKEKLPLVHGIQIEIVTATGGCLVMIIAICLALIFCPRRIHVCCSRCMQKILPSNQLVEPINSNSTNSTSVRYSAHGSQQQLTIPSGSLPASEDAAAVDKGVEPASGTDLDYDKLPRASEFFKDKPQPPTGNEEWPQLAAVSSQAECPLVSAVDGSRVNQQGQTPDTSLGEYDEASPTLRSAIQHSRSSRSPATDEHNYNRRSNVDNEAFTNYEITQNYQDFSTNIFNNLYNAVRHGKTDFLLGGVISHLSLYLGITGMGSGVSTSSRSSKVAPSTEKPCDNRDPSTEATTDNMADIEGRPVIEDQPTDETLLDYKTYLNYKKYHDHRRNTEESSMSSWSGSGVEELDLTKDTAIRSSPKLHDRSGNEKLSLVYSKLPRSDALETMLPVQPPSSRTVQFPRETNSTPMKAGKSGFTKTGTASEQLSIIEADELAREIDELL